MGAGQSMLKETLNNEYQQHNIPESKANHQGNCIRLLQWFTITTPNHNRINRKIDMPLIEESFLQRQSYCTIHCMARASITHRASEICPVVCHSFRQQFLICSDQRHWIWQWRTRGNLHRQHTCIHTGTREHVQAQKYTRQYA